MTTIKSKPKPAVQVRINYGKDQNPPVETDEVFLYRDEPYVNEVKYLKAGEHSYKEGEFTEATIDKKED